MNIQQAEMLSNKLDKLNEFFDITTSTVEEIRKEVDVPTIVDTNIVSNDINIISLGLLKEDFEFIRSTLLDTVQNGKNVINKISLDIDIGESTSAGIISAYAELVGTVNNSLKLLSSTYKDIVDLNIKIQKKTEQEKPAEIKGNVTINNINASINDVINAMKRD